MARDRLNTTIQMPNSTKNHTSDEAPARAADLAKIEAGVRLILEGIGDLLFEELHATGVMVVIEASHLCMEMRGIKKPGSKTITSALRGGFLKDPRTRAEAMSLLRNN